MKNNKKHPAFPPARGMALVSALLLLTIITILAVSMFRSFGVQEHIAGNTREKERALHAAEAAQQYAETWLAGINGAALTPTLCNSTANNWLNANLGQGQICSNALPNVSQLPWTSNGAVGGPQVGVYYNPGNALDIAAAGTANPNGTGTYAQTPAFYIADLGPSATDAGSEVYQVDAVGYGATTSTVAVVESTYEVGTSVGCRSCP